MGPMGELGALFNPGMRHELEERRSKAARREEEGNARDGDLKIDLASGVAVINIPAEGEDEPAEGDESAAADQSVAAEKSAVSGESAASGESASDESASDESAASGESASARAGDGATGQTPAGATGQTPADTTREEPPLRPRGKRGLSSSRR